MVYEVVYIQKQFSYTQKFSRVSEAKKDAQHNSIITEDRCPGNLHY
jgi:hypothetical protein